MEKVRRTAVRAECLLIKGHWKCTTAGLSAARLYGRRSVPHCIPSWPIDMKIKERKKQGKKKKKIS